MGRMDLSVIFNLSNITECFTVSSFTNTMKILLCFASVSSLTAFWLSVLSSNPLNVGHYPPMLGRALHSPTIIPSPYSVQETNTLTRPLPGDIGCVPKLQGASPFYICRGVKIQKLDVHKTPYGWRVPFLGNGLGHAVRVYVPNVRRGIIQTL